MNKVSIKTGDTVLVNSGKDSGKKGKVLKVIKTKESVRVIVEGVNIVTKAKKARTAQEKSELVKQEAAIDVSNVNVVCPSCGKPVRIKHKIVDGKKVRVCSCGAVLDTKFEKNSKKDKQDAAEKPAKKSSKTEGTAKTETTEKKSKRVDNASNKKATKTAEAKKPTTSRSAQRGV